MDQRVRVREMLRDLRFAHTRGDDVGTGAGAGAGADPTASFFAPPSHASAASFAAGSTRPSPVATPVFAHQRAMVGGGRNAPSKGSAGGHRDAAAVATWVASVLALAGVFLVIGQWVDERLMDDEASATVGTDYATVALKTCFQIAFDVALLVVPYLLLVRYAADSLLRQYYYLVVFPLWVLSLHAQGHLRERLRVLVAGEAEADDATKLARLVAAAPKAAAAPPSPPQSRSRTHGQAGHEHFEPATTVRAQRRQPNPMGGGGQGTGRGGDVHRAPWESFEQEATQTVQFTSPLLEPVGSPTNQAFASEGAGEARHTDLAALLG
jgi:hypothetical protein